VADRIIPDAADSLLRKGKADGPAALKGNLPDLRDAANVSQKCYVSAIGRKTRRGGRLDVEEAFDSVRLDSSQPA
jgi:hypothetical protein